MAFFFSFVPKPKTTFFKIDVVLRYPLRTCNCKAAAAGDAAIAVVVVVVAVVVVVIVVLVVVAVATYDDDAVVVNRIVQIMNTVAKILGSLIPSVLKKHCNLITAED
jgi:hypothetical protein